MYKWNVCVCVDIYKAELLVVGSTQSSSLVLVLVLSANTSFNTRTWIKLTSSCIS